MMQAVCAVIVHREKSNLMAEEEVQHSRWIKKEGFFSKYSRVQWFRPKYKKGIKCDGFFIQFLDYWAFHPIFVFCRFWPTKLRKCLFTFFKSLACLALQTETIVKKITQPKLPKTKKELTKICNEPGKSHQMKLEYHFKHTTNKAH